MIRFEQAQRSGIISNWTIGLSSVKEARASNSPSFKQFVLQNVAGDEAIDIGIGQQRSARVFQCQSNGGIKTFNYGPTDRTVISLLVDRGFLTSPGRNEFNLPSPFLAFTNPHMLPDSVLFVPRESGGDLVVEAEWKEQVSEARGNAKYVIYNRTGIVYQTQHQLPVLGQKISPNLPRPGRQLHRGTQLRRIGNDFFPEEGRFMNLVVKAIPLSNDTVEAPISISQVRLPGNEDGPRREDFTMELTMNVLIKEDIRELRRGNPQFHLALMPAELMSSRHHVFLKMPFVRSDGFKVIIDDLRGASLHTRVVRARECFHQILAAVEHLHQRLGVAHLDIGPENLLFNPEDGHWFLIDYAHSRLLNASVETSGFRLNDPPGKARYYAPEFVRELILPDADSWQLLRESFYSWAAIDMWQLGWLLFGFLTGQLERFANMSEVFERHRLVADRNAFREFLADRLGSHGEASRGPTTPGASDLSLPESLSGDERCYDAEMGSSSSEMAAIEQTMPDDEGALTVLLELLEVNPRMRMSLGNLLRHRWLQG